VNATGEKSNLPPPAFSSLPSDPAWQGDVLGYPWPRSRLARRPLVLAFFAGLALIVIGCSRFAPGKPPAADALTFAVAGLMLFAISMLTLCSWTVFSSGTSSLRDDVRRWRDQALVPGWPVPAIYAGLLGANLLGVAVDVLVLVTTVFSQALEPMTRAMVYAWTLPDPPSDGNRPSPHVSRPAQADPPGPASVVIRRVLIVAGLASYLVIGLAHAPARRYLGDVADVAEGFCFVVGVAVTLWLSAWTDDAARRKAAEPRPLYDVLNVGPISWVQIAAGLTAVLLLFSFLAAGHGAHRIVALGICLMMLVGATIVGAGYAWKAPARSVSPTEEIPYGVGVGNVARE